jgi:HAMP domain-containing protein
MGLKAKFNIVMLAAFVVGLGLVALYSWSMMQEAARRQVLQDAQLMIDQASAVRGYTDREVAPLLAAQSEIRFLPQSIPFFAAQSVFRGLRRDYPEYDYKEAALNPTNPADRATDWQADIIGVFQRDPDRTELITTRDTPTGPTLNLARPIKVTEQGCLGCHSTPQAAPASLIDLYGTAHGFGWKLGDVVGAQIVTVPTRFPYELANREFMMFMGGMMAIFLLMLVLLNLLLHFFIIRPVRRISATASEVSLSNLDAPEYQPRGRDEIASLAESFNRMRRSLVNAMRMLETTN